ncbi:MAG TPA: hypothetical protein VHL11_17435 [Phototrophicaceae bacterium]|jgi:hypothetical protein|nr:hypothetical protein [Phototrophicaceae bacterium]
MTDVTPLTDFDAIMALSDEDFAAWCDSINMPRVTVYFTVEQVLAAAAKRKSSDAVQEEKTQSPRD